MFSYFRPPITNLIPERIITLRDVYGLIVGGSLDQRVRRIRAEVDHKEQNKLKANTLDYVLFSASCDIRKPEATYTHSGLIAIDLDDIPDGKLLEIKHALISDESICPALIFESPSGNRLKAVYRIPANSGEHLKYFTAFQVYFRDVFNLEIDAQCKNISRACYLSHDPECYLNENAEIPGIWFLDTFTLSTPQTKVVARTDTDRGSYRLKTGYREQVCDAIANAPDGSKQSALVRNSVLLGGYVGSGAIGYQDAYQILCDAINNRLGGLATKKEFDTVAWGLHAGQQRPIYEKENTRPAPVPFEQKARIYTEAINPAEPETATLPVVPFPFEKLPSEITAFCTSLAIEQELDPAIVVMEMLALAGVINGNRFKIEIHPGWHVPSLLWIALVGATGTQKTGHLKLINGPLAQIVREDYNNWAQANNDFLATQGKKGAKPGAKPEPHVIQIGDTTQAGIVRVLKTNKHGLIVTTSEGTNWLGGMAKFNTSGSDRPFYLEGFDNGSYLVARGEAGYTYIENMFFSIVIALQSSKMHLIFGGYEDSDGFADRFLFVQIPDKLKVWTDESRDATCYRSLCQVVYGMQKELRLDFQSHGTVLLTLDERTRKERLKYMNRMEVSKHVQDTLDAEVGFKSKYITYQDRLALCFCLLRALIEGTEIKVSVEDYRSAVAVLEWQEVLKSGLYNEARRIQEVAELNKFMNGKATKKEKCLELHRKGIKQVHICKILGMTANNVSSIIAGKK